ncbi:Flagellar motor switch protein FliN [Dermatophilus congolensis]|uniref:Flagellar motor switch protein FliN n=3 Tax=Dermatophilus congolensis TaxID=1863 RepID=A0A239VV36_9MICO|nr:flagellar motor switch protein FliN [Dermatophilus congolensis]SNV25709.1 Flagellar motor switch protein FliN [Dermatophilus congolensis]
MSTNSLDVDSALLAAAGVLPAHFADTDALRLETLDPIQATTMSLPGGAIGVETNLSNADNLGTLVMVVTGLIDHAKGEIFDRNEARTLWTAALTEAMEALKGEIGDFKNGQIHMVDAFDALEKADESNVVGVFNEDTLAGMLIALPKESTGQGAAAELAAAIAAAEAEETGEDNETSDSEDTIDETSSSEDTADEENTDDTAAAAASSTPPPASPPPGMPGAPDPYAAYYAGMPAYPGPGGLQGLSPEEAAAMHAQAVAARQAAQPSTTAPQFQPLYGGMVMAADPRRIDLLREVVMGVSVELGRTQLTVQEILGLTPGSIVELDRAAGAPVDVLVNGTLIAHGEVVVVDEEFAVRISEVVGREGAITA